jgi:hypothetical protein
VQHVLETAQRRLNFRTGATERNCEAERNTRERRVYA